VYHKKAMKSFDNITENDFQKIINFFITELYDKEDQENLQEGDLAALVSFLENRYREELDFKQIIDIHVDPERQVLYLETAFDPENMEECALCVDRKGKLTKEELHPDHPLFDIYAQQEAENEET
jgi:hypothetical protein